MQPVPATLLLVLVAVVADGSEVNNLNAFCSGKKVKLETVGDLDRLVSEANTDRSACSQSVVEALNEMRSIASTREACTIDKAEAMTNFVNEHLKTGTQEIPRSLADFAVAYGMQMTRGCTREMIASFSSGADAHLTRELGSDKHSQFRLFQRYLVEESLIGVVLSPVVKTGDSILPALIMQLVPEMGTSELEVQLADSNEHRALAGVCLNLLRPVYEPVVLPLTHLVRAGFLDATKLSGAPVLEESVRFWSIAVFMCEYLKVIELNNEQVDIVGKESSAESKEAVSSMGLVAGTPIARYSGDGSEMPEEILNDSMSSIVRGFHANRNKIHQIRDRILSSGMQMIRAMFGRGKDGRELRRMLSLIRAKHGAKAGHLEEAKRSLVRYVEASRGTKSLATSSEVCSREKKPTAALGNLVKTCRWIWTPVSMLISATFLFLISSTSLIANSLLAFLHLKQEPKYSLSYFVKQYFAPSRKPRTGPIRMDTRRFESLRSTIGS